MVFHSPAFISFDGRSIGEGRPPGICGNAGTTTAAVRPARLVPLVLRRRRVPPRPRSRRRARRGPGLRRPAAAVRAMSP